MKSRSFVLQACAVGVVTAALLLTACGGLGSGYSYPYDPPYQPSHSSGSASDSSGSSSRTPESSSSESSSEEPSSPASSEPPAPSEPELTPEQRLALYRSEVLQLLNTGRTVPFPHRLPPCPTPRKPVQRSCSRRAGSPTNAPMAKITLLSCPGAIFPALFPRNYTHPAKPPLPSSFHT